MNGGRVESLEFVAQCWRGCKRNGMQSKAEVSQGAMTRCNADVL